MQKLGGVVEVGEKQEYKEMIIEVVGNGGRVMVMRRLRRQMGMNLWLEVSVMRPQKTLVNYLFGQDQMFQFLAALYGIVAIVALVIRNVVKDLKKVALQLLSGTCYYQSPSLPGQDLYERDTHL
ncbi:hypothetical protein Tco_1563375 [Tanacetum coccineum]